MKSYSDLQKKFEKIHRNCELCGSSKSKIFQRIGRSEDPGTYGDVGITICLNCGHKMLNPRFEDNFYKAYYDEMYREVAFGDITPSDLYIEQQKKRGAGVLSFIKKNKISCGKMLDHGCASGCTMIPWIEENWNCYGIDPHRPSVEMGKRLGLNIKIASGEKLPFKDGTFKLVLSLGSLEHSYDFEASMKEIYRVLEKNGFMMIRWRSNEIFGSPLEYYNHNHYRFFTPETWKIALKKFGFQIVKKTSIKLEGWQSYSYLLVKKINKLPSTKEINNFISKTNLNNSKIELNKIVDLRKSYFDRSQMFINIYKENNGDYYKIMHSIKSKKLFWFFLGGEPQEILKRSYMEAKKYVSLFKKEKIN